MTECPPSPQDRLPPGCRVTRLAPPAHLVRGLVTVAHLVLWSPQARELDHPISPCARPRCGRRAESRACLRRRRIRPMPSRAPVRTLAYAASSTSAASGEPLISIRPNSSIEAKRAQPLQRQDLRIRDARRPREAQELRLVAEGEVALDHGRRVRAGFASQNVGEQAIAPGLFDRCADRHGEPPARRQHAPHLAQRAWAIREEHERELARPRHRRPDPRTAGPERRPAASRSRAAGAAPPPACPR